MPIKFYIIIALVILAILYLGYDRFKTSAEIRSFKNEIKAKTDQMEKDRKTFEDAYKVDKKNINSKLDQLAKRKAEVVREIVRIEKEIQDVEKKKYSPNDLDRAMFGIFGEPRPPVVSPGR